MTGKEVPKTFDWVKARSECDPQKVFTKLGKVIKHDVDRANENPVARSGIKFDLICDREFVVEVSSGMTGKAVTVILEGSSILFLGRGPKDVLFQAKPYLFDTGECLLEVDGKPYRLWQVSQRAFEGFFFGGTGR